MIITSRPNYVKKYLQLSAAVFKFREDNPDAKDDPDAIYDEMDPIWYSMWGYEKMWVEAEIKKAIDSEEERIKFIEKYLL